MSSDTVTLTVDGIEVQVPRGATVLQACESIGVEIPTLCTDPRLKPYGACRMCVVEVQPAADSLVHDPGGRRHDGRDQQPKHHRHPQARDRAAAPAPSTGLPVLRSGGFLRVAGRSLRPGNLPESLRDRAQGASRGDPQRSHPHQPQPLHPLRPLRAHVR